MDRHRREHPCAAGKAIPSSIPSAGRLWCFARMGSEDGDLAIDAHHLHQLAVEQRPFMRSDLIEWQCEAGLSKTKKPPSSSGSR